MEASSCWSSSQVVAEGGTSADEAYDEMAEHAQKWCARRANSQTNLLTEEVKRKMLRRQIRFPKVYLFMEWPSLEGRIHVGAMLGQ